MPRLFRVAKRQWRQYQGLPRRPLLSDYDSEKAAYNEDDWISEPSTSRSSSGSYDSQDGMLIPKRLRKSRQPANAYAADRIPRRRCNRVFGIILGAVLVGFIIALLQLHIISQRDVASGAFKIQVEQPWEKFDKLQRIFGGIRSLTPKAENIPEFPIDDQAILQSLENITKSENDVEHLQRRALPSSRSRNYSVPIDQAFAHIPEMQVYDGIPQGFPSHAIGSYELFGIQDDICYERFGRLGPYGMGYSRRIGGTGAGMEGDQEGAAAVWSKHTEVDYRRFSWADLMLRCEELRDTEKPRTVILLRTWSDFEYDPEDLLHLRAMFNEIAIASRCEYSVHFLIELRDDDGQVWTDEEINRSTLEKALPEEFRGMGSLWSQRQMSQIYHTLNDTGFEGESIYGTTRSTYMPVQHFSQNHPEFDFIWNWEMDSRYTGHFLELLQGVASWTTKQPRKELWERSARFYVPAEHGSFEDFTHLVRIQSEHHKSQAHNPLSTLGLDNSNIPSIHSPTADLPAWGPVPSEWDEYVEVADGDQPESAPGAMDKDKYEWGVGEEADFVTFSPIFDPVGTMFPPASDLTGYNVTHYQSPPLRASVGTTTRLSRRLLQTMHRETALLGHSMASELWPASVALHHGYKAVYAPIPTYVERQWPVDYLAAVLNGGRNGASGGARTSVFSVDRRRTGATEEDRLRSALAGTSWHSHGRFAASLWRRWLGYKADGHGGEEWERVNEGRMCLPAMLLHPVKDIKLIYEDRG